MKTIGLIGGASWHSSLEYYKIINQKINKELGALNSAQLIMYSVNLEEYKNLSMENQWQLLADKLIDISLKLENSGAECIVICVNTFHFVAEKVEEKIKIPLIHISDVTSQVIASKGLKKVSLLGTQFTMETGFYAKYLKNLGIECVIPTPEDRIFLHNIIYGELAKGIFKKSTKEKLLQIIDKLRESGAEGIILGCTELPLILGQNDTDIPIFDSLQIHADAAVQFSIS